MPRLDLAPAQGYVFDGLMFVRASVNSKDLIVHAENRMVIGVDPEAARWYTRREFTNAVAFCQNKGTLPKDLDINLIAPNAALLTRLTDEGSLRKTQDHILHMLTAGRERVLGRKFTPVEILEFQTRAGEYQKRLVAAYQSTIAIRAASVA